MDKCPKCGCTETSTESWSEGSCFLVETIEKCKDCGNIKNHWVYGQDVVVNWVDPTSKLDCEDTPL